MLAVTHRYTGNVLFVLKSPRLTKKVVEDIESSKSQSGDGGATEQRLREARCRAGGVTQCSAGTRLRQAALSPRIRRCLLLLGWGGGRNGRRSQLLEEGGGAHAGATALGFAGEGDRGPAADAAQETNANEGSGGFQHVLSRVSLFAFPHRAAPNGAACPVGPDFNFTLGDWARAVI